MNRQSRNKIGHSYIGLLAGTYLMGIGTGISLLSSLSGDAVSFLWDAMSKTGLVSVEGANIIFSVILLFLVLIFDRRVLGIGTIVCPLMQNLGIASVQKCMGEMAVYGAAKNYFVGLAGIVVLSIGCGIFVHAKKGTSVYLGLGQIISRMRHFNYGIVIMIMDGICFFLAAVLAGKIMIGPMIATCISGPIINATIHILNRSGRRKDVENESYFSL